MTSLTTLTGPTVFPFRSLRILDHGTVAVVPPGSFREITAAAQGGTSLGEQRSGSSNPGFGSFDIQLCWVAAFTDAARLTRDKSRRASVSAAELTSFLCVSVLVFSMVFGDWHS